MKEAVGMGHRSEHMSAEGALVGRGREIGGRYPCKACRITALPARRGMWAPSIASSPRDSLPPLLPSKPPSSSNSDGSIGSIHEAFSWRISSFPRTFHVGYAELTRADTRNGIGRAPDFCQTSPSVDHAVPVEIEVVRSIWLPNGG